MRFLFGFLFQDRTLRYALAFAGPASTSGAQFLLSMLVVNRATAETFGHFAFLMILLQFVLGVWSALFGASLPVIVADADSERRERRLAGMFAANLLATVPVVLIFVATAAGLGMAPAAGVIFALFAAVWMMRGFARAYAYAVGGQMRVLLSDVTYGVVVIAGLPVLLWLSTDLLRETSLLLLLGSVLAMLPFGRDYARRQIRSISVRSLGAYGEIWRVHSGWSLLGVVTTEATINSHAYIVTLVAGAKSFAVLAASALLTRPVSVLLSSLSEYERARMATEIAEGDAAKLGHSLRFFRVVMMLVWVATSIALAMILLIAPRLIFPPLYSVPTLAIGSALWMAVMLVRTLRAPESAMMQAAGQFRPLALASVYSALCSVVGVTVILLLFDPLWSIAGILLGEIVYSMCLWPIAKRWQRNHMEGGLPVPDLTAAQRDAEARI